MRPKSLERSSTVECPQLKLLAVLTRGSCDWHLAITATVVRISAATVPDRRLTIMVGAIRCRPARTSSCLELLSIFQSALTTRLSLRILRVVRRRLSLRARVRRFRSLLALTVTTIFCRRAPASVCHTTVAAIDAPQTCADDSCHHHCCQVGIRCHILTSFVDATSTHAAADC